MRKTYYIPTTEITNFALTTVLCVASPDLWKAGNTSQFGEDIVYGD